MKKSSQRPPDPRRRHFFRKMVAEVVSVCEEISGRPQLRISDLARMPDPALRTIVPVVKADHTLRVEDQHLRLYSNRDRSARTICALNPEQIQFIQALDGQRTLDQLSRQVATICGLEPSEAFKRIKSLFCRLADQGVCVPLGAHLDSAPQGEDPENPDGTRK